MRSCYSYVSLLTLGYLVSACGSSSGGGNMQLSSTAGATMTGGSGTSGSSGGSGSSTSGGTAASGGGMPSGSAGEDPGVGGKVDLPPVGNCDKLPAPGMWENITPKGSAKDAVNGTVGTGIIADPLEPGRVWLGTGQENKEFWRSDDCGATWVQVNTGPGGMGDGKSPGVGDGAQWSMQEDPEVAGVLYAVSGYGAQGLWKTTDGGTSWKDVVAGTDYAMHAEYRFVNNVSLDATNRQHLVITTHGTCSAPYAPNCIAESKDGGTSWTTLKAPEAWVEGGGLVVVKDDTWVWCGTELIVTTDGGKNWVKGNLDGGGSCEAQCTIRSFVPASDGNYYLGSRNGVITSKDGVKWTHVPNISGLMVMLTQGSKDLFVSSQWMPTIRTASLDAVGTWKDLPAPPQISQGTDGGIPFMTFDDKHRILYASMFSGGVARMVVP